jgi:hypothetical protein
MAVTIDEMQVEISDGGHAPPALAPAAGTDEHVDLRAALAIVRERDLRLRAD